MSRPTFEDFKKEALSLPEVKAEYDHLAPAYELRQKMIEIRKAAGFTHDQMAKTQKSRKATSPGWKMLIPKSHPPLRPLIAKRA